MGQARRPQRIPDAQGNVISHVVFDHFVQSLGRFAELRVHWTHAMEHLRKTGDGIQYVEWEHPYRLGGLTFAKWWHRPAEDVYTIAAGAYGNLPVLVEEIVEVCDECHAWPILGGHHTGCSHREEVTPCNFGE